MSYAVHAPDAQCNCESDPTDRRTDRCEYRLLADTVVRELNPPDDDGAEVALCCAAVERVVAYVASLPCVCPPGGAVYWDESEACERCQALGRLSDVPVSR